MFLSLFCIFRKKHLTLLLYNQGREADHLDPAVAEVNYTCIYLYIHSPLHLQAEMLHYLRLRLTLPFSPFLKLFDV
jgi:hypothetical protein